MAHRDHRPSTQGAAPSGARDTGRSRPAILAIVVTAVLTLGVGATSVAVTVQENARQAEVAQAAEAARVAAAADLARKREAALARGEEVRAELERIKAERAAAVAAAAAPVEAARAALAAAPQATPETQAALQAAIDQTATLLAADPLPEVQAVNDSVAALAAPQQAVAESQAAWQAAEDARIAAEAAAAAKAEQERAAAAAAAAARTPQAASRSQRSGAGASASAAAPRASSSAPAASAPAAPAPAPAAATSGVPEFSAGAVGEAINAHRAANGLPALGISRSGTLYAHAAAMAEAGSIWHGGSDKIVGYVKPASASSLVRAWANSPAHNAWMLRTDRSSMQVGAAVLNGRLYGAVNFS